MLKGFVRAVLGVEEESYNPQLFTNRELHHYGHGVPEDEEEEENEEEPSYPLARSLEENRAEVPKVQQGCWLPSASPIIPSGATRQLMSTTPALRAGTPVAAMQMVGLRPGEAAEYAPETFRTPIDRAREVVSTGHLVNTHTGEISEILENSMPPPNRSGGDQERERKSSQLRLRWAEGGEPRARNKREQAEPMQASDAGDVKNLPFQSSAINADVVDEANQRSARDIYFNRTGLSSTEPVWTQNPYGFVGYQNAIRIQPYMPVTQELDIRGRTTGVEAPTSVSRERPIRRVKPDVDPQRAMVAASLARGLAASDTEPQAPKGSQRHARAMGGKTQVPHRAQGIEGNEAITSTQAENRVNRRRENAIAPLYGATMAIGARADIDSVLRTLKSSLSIEGKGAAVREDLGVRVSGAQAAQSSREERAPALRAPSPVMEAAAVHGGTQRAPLCHDRTSADARPQPPVTAAMPHTAESKAPRRIAVDSFGKIAVLQSENQAQPLPSSLTTRAVCLPAPAASRPDTGVEGATAEAALISLSPERLYASSATNAEGGDAPTALAAAGNAKQEVYSTRDANCAGPAAPAPHGAARHAISAGARGRGDQASVFVSGETAHAVSVGDVAINTNRSNPNPWEGNTRTPIEGSAPEFAPSWAESDPRKASLEIMPRISNELNVSFRALPAREDLIRSGYGDLEPSNLDRLRTRIDGEFVPKGGISSLDTAVYSRIEEV